MRNLRAILCSIFAVAMLMSSCSKDATTSSYDTSLKAWNTYKSKVNNTYAYTAIGSPVIGVSTETKITIADGKITNRDFLSYQSVYTPGTGETAVVLAKEWHEAIADLGTHGNEGAPLSTIDDLYYLAINVWLVADKSRNTITFETKNNGIISAAGYTPNGCKEGCFIGTQIKSITP